MFEGEVQGFVVGYADRLRCRIVRQKTIIICLLSRCIQKIPNELNFGAKF